MESRGSNPYSCCCSVVVMIGISTILVQWDIENVEKLSADGVSLALLAQLWAIVMCFMATYAWFSIPVVLLLVCLEWKCLAQFVGHSLIVLFGPNLLLWNILGCISNAINYKGYCKHKDSCEGDVMVFALTITTWVFFYLLAGIFCYIEVFIVKKCLAKRRLRSRVKNWRKNAKGGKALLGTTCSICLDGFKAGENVDELVECKHTFHRECISIWIRENPTCPICRMRYT